MFRALVYIGYVLIVLGVLLLTPLADLLPITFLTGSLYTAEEPGYWKVVPTTVSYKPT